MKFIQKIALTFSFLCTALTALPSMAAITVTDSLGEHQLPAHPKRIVALNWDLAEQLLELGITPVGVPNIKDYTTWVVKPAIPEGVEDVGTRAEPNLEKLAALKPDLILAASPQKDLIPRLQTIAPVLYYQAYVGKTDSAQAVIDNFTNLAKVVDKEATAKKKLAAMDQNFAQLKAQLHNKFGQELPSVVAMRFANQTSFYLYTENSTTQYVIQKLGLTPAMTAPAQEWGIAQKRIIELKDLQDAYVLYFGPFTEEQTETLNKTMLWQAMPFVRQGHTNLADPVWNYGGAMSMQYIAESITKSLLEIDAKAE